MWVSIDGPDWCGAGPNSPRWGAGLRRGEAPEPGTGGSFDRAVGICFSPRLEL